MRNFYLIFFQNETFCIQVRADKSRCPICIVLSFLCHFNSTLDTNQGVENDEV